MLPDDASQHGLASLIEKGIALVSAGAAEEAKVVFDQVLVRDPSCAKAFCGRGTAHFCLGDLEQALKDYETALRLAPNYARAIFNRGRARFHKGETEEAFADMDRAIEVEPEAGFYFHRAQCLRQVRRDRDAIQDLTTCIDLDPLQPWSYFLRGTMFSAQGAIDDAIRDFEEAIRRNPTMPDPHVWLAHELFEQRQFERAASTLDHAIEACGKSPDLLFRRGCVFYSVGDFVSAVTDFDDALKRGEDTSHVLPWRGLALLQLDEYDAAIADFTELLTENADQFDVIVARGEARMNLDDTDSAIRDLSHAIQLDAAQARPFFLRAQCWLAQDETKFAMDDFDHALRIDPVDRETLRARSSLRAELGDFSGSDADLDTLERLQRQEHQEADMGQRRTRISLLLSEHFAPLSVAELTISERRFPLRVRADLQKALSRLFGDSTRVDHMCGVKRDQYSYEGMAFSDLLFPASHSPAIAVPAEYEEVDVGEEMPVRCLKNGLWLLATDEMKYAVLISQAREHGAATGVQFQIAVPQREAGERITQEFFKHLEEAVARSESYRGKILSLEMHEHYSGMSTGIQVHRLRTVDREQVILPATTLELLDRNVIQFAEQRAKLLQLGLSTKKGVLFYGPPGTGKTHTIHYLAGAMRGHTTLLISAEQVALLGEYMTLARLLQPSIVVIEDADLIARERSHMQSVCEEVLLNKLLNEMDGLRPDAEVFFILTTNRPQSLEAALASRPGRIDQAIEFPLPDETGRAKLVKLYSQNMTVSDDVVAAIVSRTERASASFIKELMRRAAQFHLERNGDGAISKTDVDAAIQELLFAGGSLNCRLLGMQRETE